MLNAGAVFFKNSLELRETDVSRAADVVLPVAPACDKAGTFVTWEGRPRPFEAVFSDPRSLPDTRALAGIAEELGRPLGFRTPEQARAAMEQLGAWDGGRPAAPQVAVPTAATDGEGLALSTWKQMLDDGSLQDGDKHLAATARPAVARLSASAHAALGDTVTLTGDRGSLTLPAVATPDLAEGVVWVPARSTGRGVLADLASPGTRVTVRGAES